MRKLAVIVSLSLLCTLLAGSGCKKYEDGPYLSFKSREERISNTWKVGKVLKNEEEITPLVNTDLPNLKWTFSTNGEATRSVDVNGTTVTVAGQWALQSDDEEIRIVIDSQLYSEDTVWVIIKLMEDEFWVRYAINKDSYEVHFTPVK
jgi:hypothetical protein